MGRKNSSPDDISAKVDTPDDVTSEKSQSGSIDLATLMAQAAALDD